MEGLTQPNIELLPLDVTNDANVQAVITTIIEREGRINIVVNNAGVPCHGMSAPQFYVDTKCPGDTGVGPLLDRSIEDVAAVFDANTLSVLRVCKAAVPHMAARKQGLIVNIGSVVGEMCVSSQSTTTDHLTSCASSPTPWAGPYAASKAAVHSISQTLAMELRPLGINVLSVAPGGVRSLIASKAAPNVRLPPDSLWLGYRDAIINRVMTSSRGRSITCEQFAKHIVAEALREGWLVGSYRFVMTAPPAGLFKVFAWLPRSLVLWIMWKVVGGKAKKQ